MSQVSQDRFFLAEFRDPEALDHKFKLTLERFQLKWLEVLGWHLFRPLPETECHLVKTLRIPLNNSPVEFDAQVLALTKILIDSLNDSRLKKELGSIEAGAKSIEKLEAFLQEKGFSARQDTIQFLKDLQRLRSKGSAHLKGTGYENALSRFAEPNQDLREVFASILNQAVRMLEALSDHFLT